jgi:hypothetical protein
VFCMLHSCENCVVVLNAFLAASGVSWMSKPDARIFWRFWFGTFSVVCPLARTNLSRTVGRSSSIPCVRIGIVRQSYHACRSRSWIISIVNCTDTERWTRHRRLHCTGDCRGSESHAFYIEYKKRLRNCPARVR